MENFIGKAMFVMQVRPEFSIVYKANPKIKFKEEHLNSRKEFTKFLSKTAKHWKEGDYFIRPGMGMGTFAAFYVKKGGKVTLHKENKNNVPYLVWTYFRKKK